MKKNTIKGRILINTDVEGAALISKKSFMFAHGINPKSGKIVDKKSDIFGKNMKDKIFVFPNGKGSTTGSMWFLEAIRTDNAPVGIVNQETEMIIATGAILGDLLYQKKIAIIDNIDMSSLAKITEGSVIKISGSESSIKYNIDR